MAVWKILVLFTHNQEAEAGSGSEAEALFRKGVEAEAEAKQKLTASTSLTHTHIYNPAGHSFRYCDSYACVTGLIFSVSQSDKMSKVENK